MTFGQALPCLTSGLDSTAGALAMPKAHDLQEGSDESFVGPAAAVCRRVGGRRGRRAGHQDRADRGKTRPARGLRQADRGRPHDGPGIPHRRQDDVNGRKIVVIVKDDQSKPDIAKSLLDEAYGDDKADIAVGTTSSGAALAMLPVAEEYKKVLIVEPAVADSITGDKWNRYIFRTARNSTQDALADRGRAPQGRRLGRHAGAGLCLRPRRRRGVQGGAGRDQEQGQGGARGIRAADHHRLHGAQRSASSMR